MNLVLPMKQTMNCMPVHCIPVHCMPLHANNNSGQKELKLIPPFTYELLQEHLGTNPNSAKDGTTGAHKHKRKGYQLRINT